MIALKSFPFAVLHEYLEKQNIYVGKDYYWAWDKETNSMGIDGLDPRLEMFILLKYPCLNEQY